MGLLEFLKDLVNWLSEPSCFFIISTVLFFVFLFPGELGPAWLRRLTRPLQAIYTARVGMSLFAVTFVLFLISCFDVNFIKIVGKPDNVPIAGMIFLVGFFVWFALQQGRENDRRREGGHPLIEQSEKGDGKVLVWPDLVYTEFVSSEALIRDKVKTKIALCDEERPVGIQIFGHPFGVAEHPVPVFVHNRERCEPASEVALVGQLPSHLPNRRPQRRAG